MRLPSQLGWRPRAQEPDSNDTERSLEAGNAFSRGLRAAKVASVVAGELDLAFVTERTLAGRLGRAREI